MKKCILLLLVWLSLGLSAGQAQINVISSGGTTGPYGSIAAAITFIQTLPPQPPITITMGPGSYIESVSTWPTHTVILSGAGPGVTMLSGSAGGPCNLRPIDITNSNTGITIENMTLLDGCGNRGGGVRVRNSSDVLFRNVQITDNIAITGGGGIAVNNSSITLDNVSVLFNLAPEGSAIYAHNSIIETLNGTSISDNDVHLSQGGNVNILNGHQLFMTNARWTSEAGNVADAGDGEIVVSTGANNEFFGITTFNLMRVEDPNITEILPLVSGPTSVRIEEGLVVEDGSVNVDVSAELRLLSTSSKTAYLDDFTFPGVAVTGDVVAERYLPGPGGGKLVGAQVKITNLPAQSSGWNLTPFGPGDGLQLIPLPTCDPNALDPASPFAGTHEFRENASFMHNCYQFGWHTRTLGALEAGRGYNLYVPGSPTTIEFSGQVNTGTVTYGLTKTPSHPIVLNGPMPTDVNGNGVQGWQIASNPYPSVLDWDLVYADILSQSVGISPTIWFWITSGPNNQQGNMVGYDASTQTVIDPAGVNPVPGVSNLVASGQAFQVYVTDPAPASPVLTFQNSHRVAADAPFFYRKDPARLQPVVKLNLSDSDGGRDQILISFHETATSGFDPLYDSPKFKGLFGPGMTREASPYLSSLIEGQQHCVNGLPQDFESEMVPLSIELPASGNYKLELDEMRNLGPEVGVWLEDKTLQNYQDLSLTREYEFQGEAGRDDLRFVVHFRKNSELTPKEEAWAFVKDNIITVRFESALEDEAQVQLFNLQGQVVPFELTRSHQQLQLQTQVTPGIYFVQVQSNTQNIRKKVWVDVP